MMRRTGWHDLKMESAPLTPENLASYDAVLIATDHTCIDYRFIAAQARLVVAARNVLPGRQVDARVIKA